jgi:23S rRNA pseudouridine2605 synthase
MRLNKFLAAAGLGSRRSVEQLITSGAVKINGQVVTNLATQVLPTDAVKVGNKLLKSERLIHAVLNKPRGYLCTANDPEERKTIFSLLPKDWPRVHYVGRLDKDSEGLLIVTNDGDLTNLLTHPSHEVEKEYEVWLDKPFDVALHRDRMIKGFRIEPGFAKCETIDNVRHNRVRVILRQGLKRQIRLMFYHMGYEVERLVRTGIGSIQTGNVEPGNWRLLSSAEVHALREGAAPKTPSKS